MGMAASIVDIYFKFKGPFKKKTSKKKRRTEEKEGILLIKRALFNFKKTP